jgi:hypothetical protein
MAGGDFHQLAFATPAPNDPANHEISFGHSHEDLVPTGRRLSEGLSRLLHPVAIQRYAEDREHWPGFVSFGRSPRAPF